MHTKPNHKLVKFLHPQQGRWAQDSSLLQLPHIDEYCVKAFNNAKINGLPELMHSKRSYEAVAKVLREELAEDQIEDVFQVGFLLNISIREKSKIRIGLALLLLYIWGQFPRLLTFKFCPFLP